MYNTLSDFYTGREWAKFRDALMFDRLSDDGTLYCEHCGNAITRKYDCIGHHIDELTIDNVNDVSVSLNPENVMLVHHKCHNKIHNRFEDFTQKVYIVYGSPCSGKSTFVKNVANKDDLIIDIDNIWECVCLCDKYNKPNRLKNNVFGIRDALIDQVKTRTGKWRNAYYISTLPLATERERLAANIGAECIYIDTTKEECLARAHDDNWIKYINDWWERHT